MDNKLCVEEDNPSVDLLVMLLFIQPGMLLGHLRCQDTSWAHAQLTDEQDPTAFSAELLPQPVSSFLLLLQGIIPTQVPDFVFVLDEFRKVCLPNPRACLGPA